ncbi:hypothetical protein CKY10_22450 [Photorhabdus sp. HUG-39]|uniref:Uncharacterized protein n=1 Tax=Photorhabdus kayaii TaxID=230088 RepID=A0ABX0B462_9GAMM|nr:MULTISPECIES: hypothetical protein [Photorhabdus]MCC8375774.1 hypothetical protein [Photorhabdus bodei]NDL14355.1 hypothetical protein [Photorhabdus kayaii]NDL27872.1 hypothetical protein [Photorhabdus kayaii]RAX06534.1 hypothetical protein CKY10_22450 [Photorhabdus sp. HUG-39]
MPIKPVDLQLEVGLKNLTDAANEIAKLKILYGLMISKLHGEYRDSIIKEAKEIGLDEEVKWIQEFFPVGDKTK